MTQYCKAYQVRDLRRFEGWNELATPLEDDEIVYLWDDLTVVTSPVVPGQVVFRDDANEEWTRFCREELGFEPPAVDYPAVDYKGE
jgi:hypothetical protein